VTSGSSSTIRILLINGSLPLISGAEVVAEAKEEADPEGDSVW